MKVVALISGGKDSIYNIMKCIDHGHDVVCLANLYPVDPEVDDLDSYMYQTVGHQNIRALAHCLGLPLLRQPLHGGSKNLDLHYTPTECDEVEDLYQLLCRVKQRFPAVTAVASGAILSTYQRLRVENVCERLGLFSLAYLWQRDQRELLQEMVARDLRPMIVKVLRLTAAAIAPSVLSARTPHAVHTGGSSARSAAKGRVLWGAGLASHRRRPAAGRRIFWQSNRGQLVFN